MLDEQILADLEFMEVINAYFKDEQVQALINVPHHDSNRLNHSLKVSYLSYKLCKKFHLNYLSAAKAGLLHDLYFNRIEECTRFADKMKVFAKEHPEDALKNASELFYLTPLEKNIIVSHMWPISAHMPKYKEAFIVSLSDKYYSFKEFGFKMSYQLSYLLGVYFLFLMYNVYK